ncbi:hypothetical protein C5167_020416 [Papaver somniferum]|uniref:Neuroguidin n=1 Tax=Papaver somniferum TaxID=3469 RepID=A0A4Y7IW23_PAPSO|nr:hypothetical protein C5167_020416 [Papaver somniferum]
MVDTISSSDQNERTSKEAPRLCALLKEMKEGLDLVRSKVQALTLKVNENQFPTTHGLSYLDANSFLLMSYCQCVYYLLRKAKGLSRGTPSCPEPCRDKIILREGLCIYLLLSSYQAFLSSYKGSFVFIMGLQPFRPSTLSCRLLFEWQSVQAYLFLILFPGVRTQDLIGMIRTIDKKQEYLIKKYIRGTANTEEKEDANKEQANTSNKSEDLLRYRPNPDMFKSKLPNSEGDDVVYRPPKFVPTAMEEANISKSEKLAQRRDRQILRQAKQSPYVREMLNAAEGKPEEIREVVGAESREANQYREKMNKRARQEEEIFTRVPLTKAEKKQGKHLKKSRNGLVGLSEDFYDVRSLPLNGDGEEGPSSFSNSNRGGKKQFKRKRKH